VLSIACGDCHAGAGDGSPASGYDNDARHVDGSIDVDTALQYESAPLVPADGAPGNEYGNCFAATCHNNGVTVQSPHGPLT